MTVRRQKRIKTGNSTYVNYNASGPSSISSKAGRVTTNVGHGKITLTTNMGNGFYERRVIADTRPKRRGRGQYGLTIIGSILIILLSYFLH